MLCWACLRLTSRVSTSDNNDLSGAMITGLPTWNVTYIPQQSKFFTPCNSSGFFDPAFAATFVIADFDWSNSKPLWANTSPMTCDENLVAQSETVKAINPNTNVFVYCNFVKALPWFTYVREKIPAYLAVCVCVHPALLHIQQHLVLNASISKHQSHSHLSMHMGSQVYNVFGFLFVVAMILTVTTMESTVLLCYFHLCAEDYHWWWRSFLTGASSAVFLLGYAFVFYFKYV